MRRISKDEIYDLLCGCSMLDITTRDYGQLTVLDEDNIMEEFIPQVIDYINNNLENELLILE